VALAAAIFGAALAARRRAAVPLRPGQWLAIAAMASVSGTLIGWTAENIPLESLSAGDWLRSLAWALVALAAPVACAAAVASGLTVPNFAGVLGRNAYRLRPPLTLVLGALLIGLAVLAMQAALGLDFDPRYRDFPFAPLTGGVFPFLLISLLRRDPKSLAPKIPRPTAEVATAAMLGLSAIYIVFNETLANWQALWFCAGVAALALTLGRVRDAPG
jgi:glucan 1,3-beta-glucosidase